MLAIGVDIGKNGAFVALDASCNIIKKTPFKEETKSDYDLTYIISELLSLLDMAGEKEVLFVLEDVKNINGSGSSQNFTFGRGYGQMEGIVETIKATATFHEIEIIRLSPKKWQKTVWLESDKAFKSESKIDTKATSENAFKRIFPDVDARRNNKCTVFHDGIVDATLIAMAARYLYSINKL